MYDPVNDVRLQGRQQRQANIADLTKTNKPVHLGIVVQYLHLVSADNLWTTNTFV